MKNSICIFTIASFTCLSSAFAAKPIDLKRQPISVLQSFIASSSKLTSAANQTQAALTQLSSHIDFNQTTHIRIRETVAGYPVWGSDAVVHLPRGEGTTLTALANKKTPNHITMNGRLYQQLNEDLANTPAYVFKPEQANKALQQALQLFQSKNSAKHAISKSKSKLIVYVDKQNKAHWAYLIRFFAKPTRAMPAAPTYIMDALSLHLYEQWNDLKTKLHSVNGGGIGGNEGMVGKIIYDGLTNHFPKLTFKRDNAKKICYLQNELTIVNDVRHNHAVPTFNCTKPNANHNDVYWNTLDDKKNGGYSSNNDVLYSDYIVRQMYKDWFVDSKGKPLKMLVKEGQAMQVVMHVHDPDEGQSAYYEEGEMTFGDGDDESYPVVAPSVVAHEMSHGFTDQYSDLIYKGESGSLNESFSDMADKAVQYYVYGKNNWIIDDEILKEGGKPLRWMDEPEKDGESISHYSQYQKLVTDRCTIDDEIYENCVVHHASGIFNKAFYLISTKWQNTKKAFEIMTQANMHYWTADTTFKDAACNVISATKDYKYDVATVVDAMKQVGIDTSQCV